MGEARQVYSDAQSTAAAVGESPAKAEYDATDDVVDAEIIDNEKPTGGASD